MAANKYIRSPSVNQLATRKLLRSIKRRNNKQAQNADATPHNKKQIQKRKLNFQASESNNLLDGVSRKNSEAIAGKVGF